MVRAALGVGVVPLLLELHVLHLVTDHCHREDKGREGVRRVAVGIFLGRSLNAGSRLKERYCTTHFRSCHYQRQPLEEFLAHFCPHRMSSTTGREIFVRTAPFQSPRDSHRSRTSLVHRGHRSGRFQSSIRGVVLGVILAVHFHYRDLGEYGSGCTSLQKLVDSFLDSRQSMH